MEKSLQPQNYERLSIQEMKQDVLSHFYIEKGIAFTFYMMLKNPNRLLAIYLNEDRRKVFNPFRFLLIGVAVSTLILINHPGFKAFLSGLQAKNMGSFKSLEEKLGLPIWDTFLRAQELYLSYQNILIIISLPAVSWVTWKFFSKSQFNFAEHLVINSFVFGATYFLSSVFALLTFFSESPIWITYMISLVTFIGAAYMYKRIFKNGILRSFFGILLAYIPIYIIGIFAQTIIFIVLLSLR